MMIDMLGEFGRGFKLIVKNFIRNLGFDVSTIRASQNPQVLSINLIRLSNCDTIIDVGANEGQFAEPIVRQFPRKEVVSFEPLASAHAILRNRSLARRNWIVADRVAVGDSVEDLNINVSKNSVSSSFLRMKDAHQNAAPDSVYVAQEKVKCKPLDILLSKLNNSDKRRIYLKIDAQGYEMNILKGAKKTLSLVQAGQCEISFVELYEGQPLAHEIVGHLEAAGFVVYAYSNGFRDPLANRLLQGDVFFVKRSL